MALLSKRRGPRHERHNLEGTRGEAGLDAALRYRVDGRLFNRDYPARASVGKRSGVTPTGSLRIQIGTGLLRAPTSAVHEMLTYVCPPGEAFPGSLSAIKIIGAVSYRCQTGRQSVARCERGWPIEGSRCSWQRMCPVSSSSMTTRTIDIRCNCCSKATVTSGSPALPAGKRRSRS